MANIGYIDCPECGAGFATTHWRTCKHVGIDPLDIRSPLNDAICVMFVASGDIDGSVYEGRVYDDVTRDAVTICHADCDEIVSTSRGRFHADFIVEMAISGRRCQAYFSKAANPTN